MATSTIWRKRWLDALLLVVDLLWVVIIYLASELAIWGLSRALAPADLEFFSSVVGMLLVFSSMTVAGWLCRSYDKLYNEQIRSKVVAFSVSSGWAHADTHLDQLHKCPPRSGLPHTDRHDEPE